VPHPGQGLIGLPESLLLNRMSGVATPRAITPHFRYSLPVAPLAAVVPAGTPAADVLGMQPAGVMLSNGPGDPAGLPYAVEATRQLIDAGVPIVPIVTAGAGESAYVISDGHRLYLTGYESVSAYVKRKTYAREAKERRAAIRRAVNAINASSARAQSIQLVGLSWQ